MGETYITNDVKEECCYVSTNYKEDMELSRCVRAPLMTVAMKLMNTHPRRSDSSKIVQEYILPKYSENRAGRVLLQGEMVTAEDDVLRMNNERFTVPEVLFRPSDISVYFFIELRPGSRINLLSGLPQAGLSWTIADAISCLPAEIQGMFWANIGLIGGSVMFSGFRNRL